MMWYGWLMSASRAPQARWAKKTHIFEVDEGVANTNSSATSVGQLGETVTYLQLFAKSGSPETLARSTADPQKFCVALTDAQVHEVVLAMTRLVHDGLQHGLMIALARISFP